MGVVVVLCHTVLEIRLLLAKEEEERRLVSSDTTCVERFAVLLFYERADDGVSLQLRVPLV
jgi:hypothetical protein